MLVCCGWSFADHLSATWSFAGPGNWANGINWSTNPAYPNNGTHTYDATIALPNAQVMLINDVTVNDFNLSSGTLTGGGTLTINGAASWTGGALRGSGKIRVNGSMQIAGGGLILANRTIDIASTATVLWQSGGIDAADDAGGGGTINNAGTFESQTDDWYYWGNVLTPVFNNTGTFLKSGGSEGFTQFFFPVLNNDSFVDVQTSNIRFTGGGTNTGSFSVAEGALLGFSDYNQLFSGAGAPTTVFTSTAVLSSQGTVEFGNDFGTATTTFAGTYDSVATVIDTDDANQEGNEGRVTFLGGALVNSNLASPGSLHVKSGTVRFETGQGYLNFGDATLSNGVIESTDDLFFNAITWSSGTIIGNIGETITSVSTGSLAFVGTGAKGMTNLGFFNGIDSHATISEGTVSMDRAHIQNLAGATFDFQGAAVLDNISEDPGGTGFDNVGLLIKSAGNNTAELRNLELFNNGQVRVDVGTLFLNGGGVHQGSFTIASGATLELGAGAFGIFHEFLGGAVLTGQSNSQLTLHGPTRFFGGSTTQVDRMTLQAGAYVLYTGGTLTTGDLRLEGGSQLTLEAGNDKTLVAKSISIVQFSESALNLNDNKAIVDYDSATNVVNDIRQLIERGYNGGGWNGEGIFTSLGDATHGLGYADNHVLGLTNFGGYAVDAGSVLIKYTYFGDSNLDGQVNITDLYALASNYNTTNKVWTAGDFNYDGVVNAIDLGLLAQNWQAGVGAPLSQSYLDFALASLGLPAIIVPEPGAILSLAGCLFFLRRRRNPV